MYVLMISNNAICIFDSDLVWRMQFMIYGIRHTKSELDFYFVYQKSLN